jgi:hypothetical protein
MRARTVIGTWLALALLAAAAACTGKGGGDGGSGDAGTEAGTMCPNDLPDTCPTPTPSYTGSVSAIITSKCNGCHADGGVGQSTEDFSSYDRIHSRRGPILSQVFGCLMPPPDAGPLTATERAQLLGWLACEAPDN